MTQQASSASLKGPEASYSERTVSQAEASESIPQQPKNLKTQRIKG